MLAYLRHRWGADGGYREFLVLAFPLILSTASWSIQHFIDRVFLTWYSTETLAASYPAGMTNFVFLSLFLGTAQYVNTFVAQYMGARRPERVGKAVWQGFYLALFSAAFGLVLAAGATPLFDLIGHDPAVREQEVVYFRVLCYGIGPVVLSTAASCFFSGRGQTMVVLWVNVVAMSANILLDYLFIFGKWGLPEGGIEGAAWATNLAQAFGGLLFVGLFLKSTYRRQFATLSGWRFDWALFGRLLRFGGPSGLNFMLDILAFSLFILIAGRLGTIELAATNLASNINSLAFMPLIGSSIAVSTMVGQRLGRNQPDQAEYCTWTGFHLALGYTLVMAVAFIFAPELFLAPFKARSEGADFAAAYEIAVLLLRVVAIYCVFDSMYMTFTAALKGAGDTRFILWLSILMSWAIMVVPAFVAQAYFDASVYTIWVFLCAYVVAAAVVFYWRFKGGRWKAMRVIEESGIEEVGTGTEGNS